MKNFLLSDICDIQIGRTPSRSKLEFWGGSLPWLSIADMGKSRDIYKTKEGITELGAKTFNGRRVKEGTVLFSFKLSIGKIGIARVPLYTNEAIAALEIKEKSLVCEEYLYYALQGLNLDQKTDRAVMGKTLNKKKLAAIKVPLPSLTEQRRIAAILDKADEIRRKRSQAIQLTEDLGRSLFLDMFGDPVTNPKAWTLVTLGSQVESLKYGTNSKSHDFQQENDLPVLRIPNIIGEKISWDNLKFGAISEKDRQQLLLKKNDLLFVRSNGNPEYIGRCALFEENQKEIVYASYLIRGRLKETSTLRAAFIRDIISFPTYRSVVIKQARTTAGNYNINTQGLKSFKIIQPSLKEQDRYLNFKKAIVKRIQNQSSYLQESENLFNSLLQRAFRGEL